MMWKLFAGSIVLWFFSCTTNSDLVDGGRTVEECETGGFSLWRNGQDDKVTGRLHYDGGRLYVLNGDGDIVRYSSESVSECRLDLDGEFATDGVLDYSQPLEDFVLDPGGDLFARSGFQRIVRFSGAQVLYSCDVFGSGLALEPGAFKGYTTKLGVLQQLGFTSTACFETAGAPSLSSSATGKMVWWSGGLAVDHSTPGNLDFSVSLIGAVKSRELVISANPSEKPCSVDELLACGDGVCLLDRQCGSLFVYGADGLLQRKHDLFARLPRSGLDILHMREYRSGGWYLSAVESGRDEILIFRLYSLY